MLNNSQINLKVCGITSSQSIQIAAQKKIKTLGFASNNLLGPNTCDDEMLKELEYTKDFIMLQVEEVNTEFLKDNFEIEVFEIKPQTDFMGGYSEVLKKLHFDRTNNGDGANDPDHVEYYFDIQIDNEIDNSNPF